MALKQNIFKLLFFIIGCYALYFMFLKTKCHAFDPRVYYHLGAKSPYRFVQNLNVDEIKYPGCQILKIWAIIRHGTRKPKGRVANETGLRLKSLREEILYSLSQKKGELCDEVTELFAEWELIDVDDRNSQFLTHEGEDEMLLLGERMQKRFSEILPETYSNDTYKFRYTASQRAQVSAEQFTVGLFGRKQSHYVWYPQPLHRDPILRFYKLCDTWKSNVNKNAATYEERDKFARSEGMNEIVQKITKRLGLNTTITIGEIFSMYEMCGYETAIEPHMHSPWCFVFDMQDALALEYMEDLRYYWRDGYGHSLNYEQACPAVQDMLEHFKSQTPQQKAVFYFSHSGTLLKMLSYLNLYKDDRPLLSDNYKQQSNRHWRVSKIDSFGTNLAFVLFKCGYEYKVLTLHQERPVHIPGCPEGEDLCPLDLLVHKYRDCNFNEICSAKS